MNPYRTSAAMHRIKVKFLIWRIQYLLLANGRIHIEKNVPMHTPKGKDEIKNAFTAGMLDVGPYTIATFVVPRAVIYAKQYPQ